MSTMNQFDFVTKPVSPRQVIAAPSGIEWQRYPHSEASNEGCTSYCADGDGMTRIECWDGARERYDFETESSTAHAAGNYLNTDALGEILRLSDDIATAIIQADTWMRENEFGTWMYLDGSGTFTVATRINGVASGETALRIESSDVQWGGKAAEFIDKLGDGAWGSLCGAVEQAIVDGVCAGEFECGANRVVWAMCHVDAPEPVVV